MVIVVIGTISPRPYPQQVVDGFTSYYVNEEQFTSEKNVARRYAGQKVWPRAVYIRRARFVAVVHGLVLITEHGIGGIIPHDFIGILLKEKGVLLKIN
jgi:hypothetical protein